MTDASQTTTDDVRGFLRICRWARKNGATRITGNGIVIDFEEEMPAPRIDEELEEQNLNLMEQAYARSPSKFREALLSPSYQPTPGDAALKAYVMSKRPSWQQQPAPEAESTGPEIPAIRSEDDDPDVFAQKSDVWASQTRLPRR